ncbi:MAG: EamA family transporter [Caulobacteraceae bacterium]
MSPALLASLMMLVSAGAHAAVNAAFKAGGDKMASRALIDLSSGVFIVPLALWSPLPTGAWIWLAGSGATHLVYLFALVRTFEQADMILAYPIFRGIAPVLTAIGAVAIFGEPMGSAVEVGVVLVSLGVLATALGRHMDARSLAWAIFTGAAIATYTVIDAHGVKQAPTAASYIAWSFLIDGALIGGLFAVIRGPIFLRTVRRQWRSGALAGAGSIVSYGLALAAFRIGATPRLAALRETSVLFAIAFAALFLKERASFSRLSGAAVIGAGAAVLVASG